MSCHRSYLYAPGSSAKLLEKVVLSEADAVVLDLEDAVAPREKATARSRVVETIAKQRDERSPAIFVRVNHSASALGGDDVEAVVTPGLKGIRLPKCDSVAEVARVTLHITKLERDRGMPEGEVELTATIESARGVLVASRIAATPRVTALAFGAIDFLRDMRGVATADGRETLFACSSLAIAARSAALPGPIAPFHAPLDDLDGLRSSSVAFKNLGFSARTCLHPRQVSVVNDVFMPGAAELEEAARTIESFDAHVARGEAAFLTDDGEFIDIAVVERARELLSLAEEWKK